MVVTSTAIQPILTAIPFADEDEALDNVVLQGRLVTSECSGDLPPGTPWRLRVLTSGPLNGMQPTAGTSNPSALIDVGPGDDDLDFDFES